MKLKNVDTWQERRSASAKAKKSEIEKCFTDVTPTPASNDRGKLFTYIEYWEPVQYHTRYDLYFRRYVPYTLDTLGGQLHKRMFPSYAKAIAHLTAIKLSIVDKDQEPWNNYVACSIVEGYYTRSGNEQVTKRTELKHERGSEEGRRVSRRLARKQQWKAARQLGKSSFPIPKTLGRRTPTTTSTSPVRSSGSATSSSPTATVGRDWYEGGGHAVQQWCSTFGPY